MKPATRAFAAILIGIVVLGVGFGLARTFRSDRGVRKTIEAAPVGAFVQIRPEEIIDLGEVTLTMGGGIAGKIFDSDGRPLAEAIVTLSMEREGSGR
jgi:hypothetical protein